MRKPLVWALISASSAALALFLWAVAGRLAYPFALEWQEGGMLHHALRLRAGEPLYAEPSLAFTAFPYPPLFHGAAALAMGLVGEGLLALRLVSLLGCALVAASLFLLARRAPLAGLAACAVFFGGYVYGGAWLDVGRIDALHLGLLALGFALQAGEPGLKRGLAAGLLLGAACLTKQTGLLPAGLVLLALLPRRPRAGLAALTGFTASALAAALWLRGEDPTWLRFYLVDLLAGHPWHPPAVGGFWLADLPWLLPAALALVLAPSLPARALRDGSLLFLAGLVATAFLGRAHIGGFDNTLLPALLAAAVAVTLALPAALQAAHPRAPWVGALALLQVLALVRDPRPTQPRPEDRAAGEALLTRLAAEPGPVFVPAHPELAARAGHPWHVHWMAVLDLSASGDGQSGQVLVQSLEAELARPRWSAVILDRFEGMAGPVRALFERQLRLVEELHPAPPAGLRPPLAPPTGIPAAPAEWWVPR